MASFTQTYEIDAPAEVVWRALIDPDIINEWGGGPATMNGKVGTEFELWGGDIWGKNIEVVKNKKLKQEWYSGEWDEPSIVTFELKGTKTKTIVVLTHEHMPDSEQKKLEDGWKDFYMGPLKKLVEAAEQNALNKKK